MIVSDFEVLFRKIGCWPAACHVCHGVMAPGEKISFADVKTKTAVGEMLLAVVHPRCETQKPEEPSPEVLARQKLLAELHEYADNFLLARDAALKKSGGAFLTAEEIGRAG